MQETQETWFQSLDQEDSLEEEMATHSSILAWESPWTGNLEGYSPGGLKESDMTEQLHFTSLQPEMTPYKFVCHPPLPNNSIFYY